MANFSSDSEIPQLPEEIVQDVAQLQGAVRNISNDVVDLRNDVKEQNGDIVNLKGDSVNISSDIRSLEGDVKKHSSEILSVQGDVKNISADVMYMRDDLKKQGSDIMNLKGDFGNVTSDIMSVQGGVKKLNSDVMYLQGHVVNISSDVVQIQNDVEENSQQIDEMQKVQSNASGLSAELGVKLNNQSVKIDALQNNTELNNKRVEELQSIMSRQEVIITNLTRKCDEKDQQIQLLMGMVAEQARNVENLTAIMNHQYAEIKVRQDQQASSIDYLRMDSNGFRNDTQTQLAEITGEVNNLRKQLTEEISVLSDKLQQTVDRQGTINQKLSLDASEIRANISSIMFEMEVMHFNLSQSIASMLQRIENQDGRLRALMNISRNNTDSNTGVVVNPEQTVSIGDLEQLRSLVSIQESSIEALRQETKAQLELLEEQFDAKLLSMNTTLQGMITDAVLNLPTPTTTVGGSPSTTPTSLNPTTPSTVRTRVPLTTPSTTPQPVSLNL